MAQIVYIDETGSVGTGAVVQPYLTLVAVMVQEDAVQPLAMEMRALAMRHLGWLPADFEFHGHEIWQGMHRWRGMEPPQLIAAYEDAISLLDKLQLDVAHASINKSALDERYGGSANENAYRLGLQFLLEKIDGWGTQRRIVVADEAKEQELQAVKMVADLQHWRYGVVPGRQLTTVIDTLHFVRSHASYGVQMADMCAYVLQRAWHGSERHPDAAAAIGRLRRAVDARTLTWREPWPQPR